MSDTLPGSARPVDEWQDFHRSLGLSMATDILLLEQIRDLLVDVKYSIDRLAFHTLDQDFKRFTAEFDRKHRRVITHWRDSR
jgi:hypothetical protein